MTNYEDMSKGELIALLNKREPAAVQGEPVAWMTTARVFGEGITTDKRHGEKWMKNYPSNTTPLYAVPQPAPDVAGLVEALEFYAKGEHFTPYEPDQWDTVSGEPLNFLHHDDGADGSAGFVENGSIAKAAIAAHRKGGDV